MEKLDLIAIPLSPSVEVDMLRTEAALTRKEDNPFYLAIGGSNRVYGIGRHLEEKGVKSGKRRIISGLDNYALVFKRTLDFAKNLSLDDNPFLAGIATNPIGFQRFELYFNKAKNSGAVDPRIRIENIPSTDPEAVLKLERKALGRDKKIFSMGYFLGMIFKKHLQPGLNSAHKQIFGCDPREIIE